MKIRNSKSISGLYLLGFKRANIMVHKRICILWGTLRHTCIYTTPASLISSDLLFRNVSNSANSSKPAFIFTSGLDLITSILIVKLKGTEHWFTQRFNMLNWPVYIYIYMYMFMYTSFHISS